MIPLLRAAGLLGNAALFAAPPLVLGLPWQAAAASVALLFAVFHWACGRAPRGSPAKPDVQAAAARAAERMGVEAPRYLRCVPGWTAAAVRCGRGYGLLLGDDVAPRHREAVLAHEMAHYAAGDLFWEPFTDGPARVLLGAAGGFFRVTALPFLPWAAPLAKLTELNADRLAADAFPDYADVLRDVAHTMGAGAGVLYPSMGQRARHTARDSKGAPRTP